MYLSSTHFPPTSRPVLRRRCALVGAGIAGKRSVLFSLLISRCHIKAVASCFSLPSISLRGFDVAKDILCTIMSNLVKSLLALPPASETAALPVNDDEQDIPACSHFSAFSADSAGIREHLTDSSFVPSPGHQFESPPF
jgi:hypothetical protein